MTKSEVGAALHPRLLLYASEVESSFEAGLSLGLVVLGSITYAGQDPDEACAFRFSIYVILHLTR